MYLTPTSITYLTQFILAGAIAGYLIYLSRKSRQKGRHALPTHYIASAFTCFTAALFLLFLHGSLSPSQASYIIPLESIAVALFALLLLQFAYRFPTLPEAWKREARIALGLTTLYALGEVVVAGSRYLALSQGIVRFRPVNTDFFLLGIFLWVTVVFLRQSLRASTASQQSSLWRKLWRPQGAAARAARVLALVNTIAILLAILEVLYSHSLFDSFAYGLLQSLGILFALVAFALVYLNYVPETTSFMVKLIGITMAVMFAILGSVGWIITPSFVRAYVNHDALADHQTVRFIPNAQGGYDAVETRFRFDDDLGAPLVGDDQTLELAFDFPFYTQTWRQAFVMKNGIISLGQRFDSPSARFHYGPTPAIIPLYLDLDLPPRGHSADEGIFVKADADKATITWSKLRQKGDDTRHYTFQVTLYPSGVFEITYKELPAPQLYSGLDILEATRFIGVVPGASKDPPDLIHFSTDLPYLSSGRGGLVEDYYLDFRRYLHQLFLPLALLIVGSLILTAFLFPMFFHLNLLRPLERLLGGIREINKGNLQVEMPIQFYDEIGFITQSFNAMVADLRDRTSALHKRTAYLEAMASVSSTLRQAMMVEDIVDLLVKEMAKATEISSGCIYLLEDGKLALIGSFGIPKTATKNNLRPHDIPCWPRLQGGEVVRSNPVDDQGCAGCPLSQTQVRDGVTLIAIPLQNADQVLGLLQISFCDSSQGLEEAISIWVAIAEMGANALARAKTVEMLDQLVQKQARQLWGLYEIAATTAHFLDLGTILERMLDKTLEMVEGESAIIQLLDEEEVILRHKDEDSDVAAWLCSWSDKPHLDNLISLVVEQHQAPVILSAARLATFLALTPPNIPLTWIGLPIQTSGDILGVLGIFAQPEPGFSVEDIILLTSIAGHIGIAVESAQLRQQAREAAVQEERRRLGRDLHDSVTQSLYSMVLSADTARYLLDQGHPQPLEQTLEQLRESARQALREMRLLLYELRLTPLPEMNLADRLKTRLEAVEQRAGVETLLSIDPIGNLSPTCQEELYCIAMEALNNALRHARASQVAFRLQNDDGGIVLEVRDDGRGFEPERQTSGGIGLRSMAERARRLGGQLTVQSAPGRGTTVRLTIDSIHLQELSP